MEHGRTHQSYLGRVYKTDDVTILGTHVSTRRELISVLFLFFTVFERDVLSHFQFLLTKMIKQYNATDEIYFCEQLMGHFLRVK